MTPLIGSIIFAIIMGSVALFGLWLIHHHKS